MKYFAANGHYPRTKLTTFPSIAHHTVRFRISQSFHDTSLLRLRWLLRGLRLLDPFEVRVVPSSHQTTRV